MKKFLAVVSVSVFGLLVTGCGGPAPEAVCDHMAELAKKELGDAVKDDDLKEMKKECVEEAKKEKEKDPAKYKEMATCMMGSKSMEDMMKCDKGDDDKEEEKKEE